MSEPETIVPELTPEEAYHLDYDHISTTMLKQYDDDSRLYAEYFVWRRRPKPYVTKKHVELGKAIHAMALRKKDIDEAVSIYPESCIDVNDNVIGKSAKKWREKNPGKTYLKSSDVSRALDIMDCLRESEIWPIIEAATRIETEARWRCPDSGLMCRSMPDFEQEFDRYVALYDFKFSEDISDTGFQRSMESQRWWLQDVHYSTGAQVQLGKPAVFRFVSVETEWPYRIMIRDIDPISREKAFARRAKMLREIADRHSTGDWECRWAKTYTVRALWND